MTKITAHDAYRQNKIVGNLVKRFDKGLTIVDDRGVIHYVTFDRVVEEIEDVE